MTAKKTTPKPAAEPTPTRDVGPEPEYVDQLTGAVFTLTRDDTGLPVGVLVLAPPA